MALGDTSNQPSHTDRRRPSSDDFDFVEDGDEFINYSPFLQQLFPTATQEELESFLEVIYGLHPDVVLVIVVEEEEEEFVRVDGDDRRDGLSEEVIRRNLKLRLRYQREEDGEEICTICQCEYDFGENVGRLECGHEYHVECIEKWLLEKNMCPLCKRVAIDPIQGV